MVCLYIMTFHQIVYFFACILYNCKNNEDFARFWLRVTPRHIGKNIITLNVGEVLVSHQLINENQLPFRLLRVSIAWERDYIAAFEIGVAPGHYFLSCWESLTTIRISSFTVLSHIITETCPHLTKHTQNHKFFINLRKVSAVAPGHYACPSCGITIDAFTLWRVILVDQVQCQFSNQIS